MKTEKEKQLEIDLLIEKIQRISKKKVVFKESAEKEVIVEMAYGSEYEQKVLDYLNSKGSEGAVAKELIGLFPTQTMSIPVLQRLIKANKVVRDMNQRPGKWYSPTKTPKGFTPSVVSSTPVKKVSRVNKSEEIVSKIKSDFYSFRPDGQRPNEIEVRGSYITSDFRHLGNWIDDEEGHDYDDGDRDWREDNDQRIWAPGMYKRYAALFKQWAKEYPWYKKVDLHLNTSEKDWCEFSISLKK